jgi:hypothetical protein
MNPRLWLAAFALACFLAGCAKSSSSLEQSWKSPAFQGGPVQKVAVIAIDDRGLIRQGFENRFVRDFRAQGQEALVTHELLSLTEIKADKKAAADRFLAAGADTVLIVRLVDRVNYNKEVRATPEMYAPIVIGAEGHYGWYEYYSVAYMDMSTVWGVDIQKVYLDTSLFDLKTGRKLWSALTLTTFKGDADRLAEWDVLIAKVVDALRKDGMVR